MTTDSETLERLMKLEQWTAVHEKVCEIQNQVNEAQNIAISKKIDRGFNRINAEQTKLDKKFDRLVDRLVKVGGVFVMLCISGLIWYVSKDVSKLHTITDSSNIAQTEYRGKP